MPTKLNRAGEQQNYVPAGNGDASGEYGDSATGSNKHFTTFKKPGDKKQFKGRSKLVKDSIKRGGNGYGGAFEKNNKQYITNGFYAVAFNTIDDSLEKANDNFKEPTKDVIVKAIDNAKNNNKKEQKVDFKYIKDNIKGKDLPLIKIGDNVYNGKHIIDLYNSLGDDVNVYENTLNENKYAPLYLKGSNGESVIMPLKENENWNTKDYIYSTNAKEQEIIEKQDKEGFDND